MRLEHTAAGAASGCTAFLYLADGGAIRFAVVSDPLASGRREAAGAVLAQAAGESEREDGEGLSWPERLAGQIDRRLREKREGDPAWLVFAAGQLTSGDVPVCHVCTAGDLRICLLSGRDIVHATRDHVARNESPEWLARAYPGVDLVDHATMLTRSLGTGEFAPESSTWPIPGVPSLLVCSSEIHGYRSPIGGFDARAGGTPAGEGVLLRIDLSTAP